MKLFGLFNIFLLLTSSFAQNVTPPSQNYTHADVVFVIDQFMNPQDITKWMNTILPQLEQTFTGLRLGATSNTQNHYGLVVFGAESQARSVLIQGQQFVPLDVFINNVPSLLSSSNFGSSQSNHDGYAAMQLGLNYEWHSDSLRIMHFISPRWRQVIDQSITSDSLVSRMKQLNVTLNVVVNSAFTILPTRPQRQQPSLILPGQGMNHTLGLIFINQQRIAYYVDSDINNSQTLHTITGLGRIDAQNSTFTTVDDYVELVEHIAREDCLNPTRVGGSAFDLRYALKNDMLFNSAFNFAQYIQLSATLQGQVQPFPQPLPQPQPSPQPVVCPFPTGTFLNIGDSIYYYNSNIQNLDQAKQACQSLNGHLGDVNSQNINTIAPLIGNNNPVWINSWEQDTYGGQPLVLLGNSISIRGNTIDLLGSLCQISPVPLGCTN